mmetsp:Transcript_71828/g.155956  ORF Transcript_71828/g.155956 Transcript_71828/m.155956 type:complete len:237 (+) Transcript_71828:1469-2179(+)
MDLEMALEPFSARVPKIRSTTSAGIAKEYSSLAYFNTSLRLSAPSASLSYCKNTASLALSSFLAAAILTAFSFFTSVPASVVSTRREHSLILERSLVRVCLFSGFEVAWLKGSFMSWPWLRMKSVQAFDLARASCPAVKVAFTSSSTSSASFIFMSFSVIVSASSFNEVAAASAVATTVSSSWSSLAAFSSERRWASFIFSRFSLAASMACVDSVCMRPFWVPQAFNSLARMFSTI